MKTIFHLKQITIKIISMSRFKLFGLMQAIMFAITANQKSTRKEKDSELASLNRRQNGRLLSSGVHPSRTLNQRQQRKRWAQTNQHSKVIK